MQSANEQLCHYTGTEAYHQYFFNMLLTDGVKAMAEEFQSYWMLDIIVFWQPWIEEKDFQVWKLEVKEDASAVVTCTDGNGVLLKQKEIPFTDFTAKEATIWVEGNVLLLPSEH